MRRPALALAASLLLLLAPVLTRRTPTNPLLDPSVSPERGTLSGQVTERLPAGTYVYLRLRDLAGAEHWLVTLDGPGARSTAVAATLYARADHFRSPRLARDFAPLHFASVSPRTP